MSRVKKAKLYSGNGSSRGRGLKPWQRPALIALAASAAAVGMIALWESGWMQRQAQRAGNGALAATASLGFSLQSVTIEGREHTGKDELLTALQVERGMPVLALDRHVMASKLQQLPWLASATIERQLPDTLLVRITERQPLARWQYQNQLRVVDREGAPIAGANVKDFADLPLIVGAGAGERAYELLAALADYPAIQKVMRAAICVGERRWDLQLEPGVMVRMPEGKESEALKKLSTLLTDPQILSREVQAVDLRLPDRMIIERPPSSIPATTKTAKGGLKR